MPDKLDIMNIPLYEFGINADNSQNLKREELIKEIYLANTKEIDAFLNIIKTIKKLK